MKRMVIIGSGYAGMGLASALDRRFEVRMIEPRDRRVHNLAAIRALAEGPPLLRQRDLQLPRDRRQLGYPARKHPATAAVSLPLENRS